MSDEQDTKDPTVVYVPFRDQPPTHKLRIGREVYDVPEGVLRLAVVKLVELAPCGTDFSLARQDLSVAERSGAAIRFLDKALLAPEEADIEGVIVAEVERLGGGKRGALEAYANLMALEQWLTLFYGDFSERFLCGRHRHIAKAQDALAEEYLNEQSVDAEEARHTSPEHEGLRKIFGAMNNFRKTLEGQ